MTLSVLLAFNLYWHLPLLVIVVSIVFAAARHDSWGDICHDSWRWFLRLAVPLLAVGLIAYLLSLFF